MSNDELARYIFELWVGNWQLKRNITIFDLKDDSANSRISATGTANFSKKSQETTLHYQENLLTYWNSDLITRSNAKYQYILDNHKISKLKWETTITKMYDLSPKQMQNIIIATGKYICGNDCYYSSYRFTSTSNFSLNYRVIGSTKNFQILTAFNKIQE